MLKVNTNSKSNLATSLGFQTDLNSESLPRKFSALVYRQLERSTPAFNGLLYVTSKEQMPAITSSLFWTRCPVQNLRVYQFVGRYQHCQVLIPRYTSYEQVGRFTLMAVQEWQLQFQELPNDIRESMDVVMKGIPYLGSTMVDVLDGKVFDIHKTHAIPKVKDDGNKIVKCTWAKKDRPYYDYDVEDIDIRFV